MRSHIPHTTTLTTTTTINRIHCAHVPYPWVPINLFFSFCIFLGRIVFHVTSAQYCGVLQKVTRRRRICEWTPWCVPAHRSEGGGDLCRCTPEHPLLRLTHIYAPPLPPPVTVPLPPDEWGSPRYQLCHHAGVVPNPPASCAFQNLKARLSYLMILYDFCVCTCVCVRAQAFVGLEACCPLIFSPGQPKSMAAELDKIKNRTNCAYQQFLKCNEWKTNSWF